MTNRTLGKAIAVAVAELRIARRVVRTWVFAALALGIGLVLYHGWSMAGTMFGETTPPRFALPGFGIPVLCVLIAGIVFLAFDIRARDERDRVAEVLDARPISNIVLLAGRWLAIAFAAWLPLAVLAVVVQASGFVVEHLELPAGVSAEPVSLATFVFLDAPTALLLWSAVVILLTTVFRYRLAVAVVALAFLGAYSWALFATPLYLLPVVSGIANLGLLGSEIVPRTASAVDLLQRGSILALAAGLLSIAAAALERRDANTRSSGLVYGAVLLAVAVGGLGALVGSAIDQRDERMAWRRAHEALLGEPRVDVERLSGTVSIDPGRELAIDVDLAVAAPEAMPDVLHFSLNPGLAVESVHLDGAEAEFVHALGLVTVTLPAPVPAGARAELSIRAHGVPDPRFAYLDSADWALDEPLLGKPLVLRGDQASLFDADYVALTPAVAWLPLAGPNIAMDDPGRRTPDFHEIDLVVRIPEGWRAAGPGRLEEDDGLRFRPRVALAEFPLFAGRFERLALTEGVVEFELLLHPAHRANVEYFSQYATSVVQHIRQGYGFFASPGPVAYPHARLSVVEVPAQLRRYGSGQVMDTIQALPGVQMLAEHGFPTTRYSARPRMAQFTDEQWLQQMLFSAEGFGPLRVPAVGGATDNLLPLLSSARGEGALAANFLLETLTAYWARVRRQVAPGHWLRSGPAPAVPPPVRVLSRLLGTGTFTFGWYQFFPMTLEEKSAEFSFTGVDATASEEGVDIMLHKGTLIALAVERLMGRSKIGEFLALMRQRYGGGTFTVDDFVATMTEVDPDMGPYIGHYMREIALPGFLVSDLRVFRLPDDANGAPRYQVAVDVRNDEPVPGLAGLYLRAAPPSFFGQWGEFVHVPGNTSLELGVVTQGPPEEVRLETYLSKNARISRLPIPSPDAETIVPEEPLNGARPSDWRPPDIGIVVDDLDPGFSFVSPPEEGFWPSSTSSGSGDGEVSEYYFGVPDGVWYRHGDPLTLSWGKYRRTLMRIGAGEGKGRATFAADLPASGSWRVFYHLPGSTVSGRSPPPLDGVAPAFRAWDSFGTYDFELVAGDVRQTVEYDARTAVSGWNDIGTFELPAGPVSLEVSDSTDGSVVVADAVRWQLVGDDP
ncbi:MAG: hypothetical protein OXU77_07300 [Gammaproteobacteria bacterium]|nr:hypothetical protein [Gammaproteobacteria bacterium]